MCDTKINNPCMEWLLTGVHKSLCSGHVLCSWTELTFDDYGYILNSVYTSSNIKICIETNMQYIYICKEEDNLINALNLLFVHEDKYKKQVEWICFMHIQLLKCDIYLNLSSTLCFILYIVQETWSFSYGLL